MSLPRKKVLVAFSSKYGYVKEISEAIVKKLVEEGLETDIINLGKTSVRKWPRVVDYSGIIVGSCGGSFTFWRRDPKNFVRNNLDLLLSASKMLAFFKSDPYKLEGLVDPDASREDFEKSVVKNFGFKPPICEAFGPVLDFSRRSKVKQEQRKSLRTLAKSISKKTGLEFDYKGYNDFRDWERIQNFTINFAKYLNINNCPECGSDLTPNATFCANCGKKLYE